MATMKLYELVNHYHIGTELTCAEAMFMACNEYYHLNLSEETRKMFSVMGLGMQTEHSCCGAFTVAVGIIGLMTAKEGQTDVSNMEGYQMIAELTEFMLGFYGTLHCVELQKLEIVGVENPCHAIVEALAKKLEEMLDKALEMELDEQVYAYFCRDLRRGGKLVYLTDNAGEIGFDRVLAEAIAAAYPDISVTFCVRGAIAQNDATREDAAAVGIPFPVIDNGNRVAGTQLDMLSEEAAAALSGADVILAKGMANAETMLGCGYNVYYAFLVKCQRFVTRFGKPMFTPMLVKERE
mgnify:CR=1 FL=1